MGSFGGNHVLGAASLVYRWRSHRARPGGKDRPGFAVRGAAWRPARQCKPASSCGGLPARLESENVPYGLDASSNWSMDPKPRGNSRGSIRIRTVAARYSGAGTHVVGRGKMGRSQSRVQIYREAPQFPRSNRLSSRPSTLPYHPTGVEAGQVRIDHELYSTPSTTFSEWNRSTADRAPTRPRAWRARRFGRMWFGHAQGNCGRREWLRQGAKTFGHRQPIGTTKLFRSGYDLVLDLPN